MRHRLRLWAGGVRISFACVPFGHRFVEQDDGWRACGRPNCSLREKDA